MEENIFVQSYGSRNIHVNGGMLYDSENNKNVKRILPLDKNSMQTTIYLGQTINEGNDFCLFSEPVHTISS